MIKIRENYKEDKIMNNETKKVQFDKCRNCRYLCSYKTKPNGSQQAVKLNRTVLINEHDYSCLIRNNYNTCENFLNYKKYSENLTFQECRVKQKQEKISNKNKIKVISVIMGVIAALGTIIVAIIQICEFFEWRI